MPDTNDKKAEFSVDFIGMRNGQEYGSMSVAAEETGLSRPTIRNRITDGTIHAYYIRGLGWLVSLSDARDNADFRKSGRKPYREITA